eukprot:8674053-Pyramimonas_sp.AAC.1
MYVHVDDGIGVAADRPGGGARQASHEPMAKIAQSWEEQGIIVDEQAAVESGDKVVGYEMDNFPP